MAEVSTRKTTRKPRSTPDVAEKLKALQANRERLDAEAAERRKQEDAALRRHATASARVTQIEERKATKLAELADAARAVEAEAEAAIADAEADQAAAVAELYGLGRKVEDLAVLFELPVKRIRRILRDARPAKTAAEPVSVAPDSVPDTGTDGTVSGAHTEA